jgi:ABC-type nitrate/sulfonate/bicarbonate transport system substrate-binding protein
MIFRGIAPVLLLLSLAVGCSTAPAAAPASVVRWGETVSSPTMLAGTVAYLRAHPEVGAKYGVQLQLQVFAQGGPMYDAFRGGSLDLMDGGGDSIATFAQQGIPLIALKPWTRLPKDWVIAVKADSPYKTLADLKGKNFASLTTSGTSYYAPYLAFKQSGLDLKQDLQIVALPPPALYSSILDGKVDAALLTNPNTDKAQASGQFRFLSRLSDDISAAYNTPYFHLIATSTKQFNDTNPKAARGAVAAFQDVLTNVSTDDLAQAIVNDKEISLGELADLKTQMASAKENLLLTLSTEEVKVDLDRYYQLLLQVGAIQKPVDLGTLFQLT